MSRARQQASSPRSAARRTGGAAGADASARVQGSRRLWGRLAMGVFLLPVMAVLLPTAIVLGLLMLPAIVAYIVDRAAGRAFAVVVGMPNAVGSLPAVLELWAQGHTLTAARGVLGEPVMWLVAYMAAASGWAIFILMPPLVRRYYETVTANRLEKLRARQALLVEEWGEAVTRAGDDAANKSGRP